MMAAVQPFLSGGHFQDRICQKKQRRREIASVYTEGWRLGLKAIAIYRDGSKRSQAAQLLPMRSPQKEPAASSPKPESSKYAPAGTAPRNSGRGLCGPIAASCLTTKRSGHYA